MPLTEAQIARQKLAGLIRQDCDPGRIEEARRELDFANARTTVASWTTLTLTQRIQLANDLITGDYGDAA